MDELFRRIAEQRKVAFIPRLLDKVDDDPALMQADGVHPTAEAQPRILDNVWPVLQPLL
jgi:acyl-CoA thioesterase-1